MRRCPAPRVRQATAPDPARLLLSVLAALLPLAGCAAPAVRGGPTGGAERPGALAQDEDMRDGELPAVEGEGEGEDEDEDGGGGDAGAGPSISGYVTARSRSRWSDDDADDHNLYAIASVDLETGGEDPWRFHVMGRGQWQVDGPSDDQPFFGIEDTWGSAVTGRLYHAYVDAPQAGPLGLARLGRQQMVETPVFLHFDGLRLETRELGPAEFLFGLHTGFPVRLFRDDYTDRVMGGCYAAFRPWETGQMRLDYLHLVDDPRYGSKDNDLVSVGLKQRVGSNVRLEGVYGNLDGESRDVRLAASWIVPDEQLTLRYSFYNLFEAQTDLVNELDPFFDALRTWYPFYQNKATVSKVFGEWLELQLGVDFRRVTDEDDIGSFNREFDRYYVTATLLDQLPLDTSLGLTGEIWDSPGNDINSWGLDLTSRWSEAVRTSIGTYYSLFKYYLDIDTERTNVRTYYVELRDRVGEPTDIMVRYEFEDDELFQYHTLRLGITWKF